MPLQTLSPSLILAEFTRLLADELRGWGEAMVADRTRDCRAGDTLHVAAPVKVTFAIGGDPPKPECITSYAVRVQRSYEYADIGHLDLTLTIDRLSDVTLLPVALMLAKKIQARWTFGAKMVTALQEMPAGLEWNERCIDPDSGLATGLMRSFDIVENRFLTVFDVLLGFIQKPKPHLSARQELRRDLLLTKRSDLDAALLRLAARRAAA